MNYLDDAYGVSQVEGGVSNLLRRGRSLETKQETTLENLTLLPWTKGADQEKRLFEYQLGVSGFIFMGLTSHQYQFALTWFHIGPIHPNTIYQMFRCFQPPCLFLCIYSIFNPGLPSLHFTRSSILVLSASAALSIFSLRIKPQSAQDSIPIHISQSAE